MQKHGRAVPVLSCAGFDQRAQAFPKLARRFGNTASALDHAGDDWHEFASDQDRVAARTGYNLTEVADVWMFAEEGSLVRMVFTSPSGDWVDYVDYCFRADGTLATIDAELRTFCGGMIVNRRRSFDSAGRKTDGPIAYRDLQTKAPTTANGPEGLGFQDHAVPEYMTLKALPFWKLLATPSGHLDTGRSSTNTLEPTGLSLAALRARPYAGGSA